MNMKLYIPIWRYKNRCFYIVLFYQLPNYLTFLYAQKSLCFLYEFSNWGHYECKILDEGSIKLNHSVEYLNLLWTYGYRHLNYGLDFLRSCSLPSFETINPSIISKNTIKAHLFGFKLIPNYMHFWKHDNQISLSKWVFGRHKFTNIILEKNNYVYNSTFNHLG